MRHLIQKLMSCILFSSVLFISYGQSVWTQRNPLPVEGSLNQVIWGDSLLVVVGDSGAILTSPNGTDWTKRISGTKRQLDGVACSGDKFIAFSSAGFDTIFTSSSGKDWTSAATGIVNYKAKKLIAADGKFIAIASQSDTNLISSDGTTWSKSYIQPGHLKEDIVWTGSEFFIAEDYGEVVHSSDGVSWSDATSGTVNNGLRYPYGICWTGTQLVEVGGDPYIKTSTDGATWTQRDYSSTSTGHQLNGVACNGNYLVAVGGLYESIAMYSSDGVSWTVDSTGVLNSMKSITWTGKQFVAVGDTGAILTSQDGKDWVPRSRMSPGPLFNLHDVKWTGSRYLAAGNANSILTSDDGIKWNVHFATKQSNFDLFGIVWTGSQYVAAGGRVLGNDNGTIYTSPDCSTWTSRTTGLTTVFSDIVWTGNQLVVVGSKDTALTSTDGISWVKNPINAEANLNKIIWTGTQLAAVGQKGCIVTSPDGVTWTKRTPKSIHSNFLQIMDIVWTGSRFFLAGYDSYNTNKAAVIQSSSDGVTWDTVSTGLSGINCVLYSINWVNGQLIASGYGPSESFLLSSADGTTWKKQTLSSSEQLIRKIAYNNKQYVAVGDSGLIITAPDDNSTKTISARFAHNEKHEMLSCSGASIILSLDSKSAKNILHWSIYDISGRQIKCNSTFVSGNKLIIPAERMTRGLYILKLQSEGFEKTFHFQKY